MQVYLDEQSEEKLDSLVEKALGEKFTAQVKEKVTSLSDELSETLHWYVEDDLKSNLQMAIHDEATRAAGRFMDAVVAGDEKSVQQFLKLPSGYLPHMEERNNQRDLISQEWHGGGIALRKKLLESVLPRLESERIKDLEAQSEARRNELIIAQNVSCQLRSDNRELNELCENKDWEIQRLKARLEKLEAGPSLSVVGE